MRDQAPRNLDDALANVSGITQGNNFGATADTVMKRGFGDNRDGSIMRDGMPLVQSEIRDNPNLTPTAEAQKTLYVLQPLPQKIERIRTRVWSKVKSGQ